jgi:hypothetical protein
MRFPFRNVFLAIAGLVLAGTAQLTSAQQTITCSSDDGGRHVCPVDARAGVQMTNQRSGAACQQGYSWGYDRQGIWVDHGCRADFTVNSRNNGWNGGGQSISCSSDDGNRHTCPVDARGGVQMTNQRSGSACQQGYSWGYDPNGIWVDHGCRADFMVSSFSPYNGGGGSGQTITCSSDDGGRHTCPVDARGGVQMTNQRSGSACQQGYSWGYDPNGIWVDHGCRADFMVSSFNPYDGDGGSGQTITCSSDDGNRHTCPVDARGGVQMTNQRSGSPCQQGYSWGYDPNGIWVDHGCRADFMVNSRSNRWNGGGQTITCSSDDGNRHYCSADTRRGVQMTNQRSGSPCQQGYSWGYDPRGIWVDHGCRADFVVR